MSNATELLAQLRDIRIPAPPPEPSLWPVLAALLVLLITFGYLAWHLLRRRNRWATDALVRIKNIQQQNADNAVEEYAYLLKQIAVTVKDESGIRQLHGQDWLQFLDRFFSTHFFSTDAGQIFGDSLYRQSTIKEDCADKLGEQLKRLIRRRRLRPW